MTQGLLFKEALDPIKVGPYATNAVYQEDCIKGMKQIPDGAVDLVIADPPYNLSKGGNWCWDSSAALPGFGGDWNKVMANWDDMPLADYLSFTLAWLREVQRVVKPQGSLWVHGTYHNAGIINLCMQMLHLEIINEVVWYKRNSFPNLSGRRMTASHETILWAHTGKKREYLFNYEAAKEMECLEDGLKSPGKQMRTVWDIPNNKERKEIAFGKHPTQKPVRLLRRMLALSAVPRGVVLIPFAGAGSECVAAKEFGAHFLAFELENEYVDVCHQRLGQSHSKRRKTVKAKNEGSNGGKKRSVPSLIKWTGSKRSHASCICALMPYFSHHVEPFLGVGAVMFFASRGNALAGDVYEPLVNLWRIVQEDPDSLVQDYAQQWNCLQEELDSLVETKFKRRSGIPEYYYHVRSRFNQEESPLDLNFLMRTCVNGIVRFNDDGEFNNSFHLSRRGMNPERFEKVVQEWHRVVKGVLFVCQDYEATLASAKRGDFVYLDPPYAGNHQRYVESLDLERFFGVLEDLNRRDVKWALSFDGIRGENDLTHDVPSSLFKRQLYLENGNSAVHKVLNGPIEMVRDSLYLNY